MTTKNTIILVSTGILLLLGFLFIANSVNKFASQNNVGGDSVTSRFTSGSANVGTASAQVLAANSARDWVHLSNCDGHVNFFTIEDTAVLNTGITLGTTTGTDVDIFGDNAKGQINGISAIGGGKVCYTTRP